MNPDLWLLNSFYRVNLIKQFFNILPAEFFNFRFGQKEEDVHDFIKHAKSLEFRIAAVFWLKRLYCSVVFQKAFNTTARSLLATSSAVHPLHRHKWLQFFKELVTIFKVAKGATEIMLLFSACDSNCWRILCIANNANAESRSMSSLIAVKLVVLLWKYPTHAKFESCSLLQWYLCTSSAVYCCSFDAK